LTPARQSSDSVRKQFHASWLCSTRVAAIIRGMKRAFADPAAAGAIMQKIVPQVDATVAKKETEAVAELAQIPGQPLGKIDPAHRSVVKGAFQLATRGRGVRAGVRTKVGFSAFLVI
jgi:hypothetical protein